nr:MAG TPA: hypothetical protein [Caudoviricetes sp.]
MARWSHHNGLKRHSDKTFCKILTPGLCRDFFV